MIYVGIDPGLDGAVATIGPDGAASVYDTPTLLVGKKRVIDAKAAAGRLSLVAVPSLPFECWAGTELDPRILIGLERVHTMPKQGIVSAFSFGTGYGVWLGVLAAYGLPHELVTPQAWKKVMLAGAPKEKDSSRQKAIQLFPGVDLHLKKHHGRADALLIAEYLRRTVGKEVS